MARRYSAADARLDVGRKSAAQFDRESAEKWSKLAIECFRRYAAGEGLRFLREGEVHRHEALEHASGVSGAFVNELKARIDKVRPKIQSKRGL